MVSVVAFSSHARIMENGSTNHSHAACFVVFSVFFVCFFVLVDISSCTPVPFFWDEDKSTVAQRAETTVEKRSLELRVSLFLGGFPHWMKA